MLPLGFAQSTNFLLVLFALRNVAGNLAEAAQLAIGPVHRRDNQVGPETRPVFAQPPTFVFEAALLLRHFQRVGRLARRNIFGRVEAAEMLPDDLLGGVALDSLRPFVPAHYS